MVFMKILFFNPKFSAGFLCFFCCSCSMQKLYQMKAAVKSPYEQITFIELMKKYMDKDISGQKSIEGIYSVSASAVKKGKGLFSSTETERTLDQKENYVMVVIVIGYYKNVAEDIEDPVFRGNQYPYLLSVEVTRISVA